MAEDGGISTRGYESVQTTVRDVDAMKEEAARTITRIYKRDASLVITTLVESLIIVLLAYAVYQQGMQGIREIPYVVFIDELGNHHPAVRVPDHEITVPEGQMMGVLIRWVRYTRSISSDLKVLTDNWLEVRDFSTNAAWAQLEPFYEQQKSRALQRIRVQVSLPKVTKVAKSRTYLVEWEETAVDPTGAVLTDVSGKYEARLAMADFSDKANRERLNLLLAQRNYRNLLGIAVDEIQWGRTPTVPKEERP